MQQDAWFFVGIFVFIFLIWIATGGPTQPLSFSGPTLPEPQELGGGTYLALPRAPFSIGNTYYVRLPGSTNGAGSYDGQLAIPALEGIPFGSPSPFRSSVYLNSYVSNASSSDPRNEYIELSVQGGAAPVTISGWKLVSEATGKAATIPKGTIVPTSGIVNPTDNIVLMPGDRAIISSGRSPIGVSFRENKCIGYLDTLQRFSPSLPLSCPLPEVELINYYGEYRVRDASCIEYVDTLPRCQAALSPPKSLSSACRSFVTEHFTYNGCVLAHKNDANFHGDVWHIYLGQTKSLWRSEHEVIKLWDASGRTVSAFSY